MKFIVYIIFFITSAFLQAEEEKFYLLKDSIVVTANRNIEKIAESNSSISVLSKEDIRFRVPRTTPEALINTSGVFIQKTNHGGGSPFVRGLTGQQTLILIDGIRLNNSTTRSGPNQYLNTIDVFSLDKIEVLKGAGSVEYGSDAIGGTINIITQKPQFSNSKFSLNSDLNAVYMSQDMEKTFSGSIVGGSKNIAFLAQLTYSDYGDIYGGNNTGIQKPSGYDQISGNLDLKIKTSISNEVLISTQILNQNEVPVFHKVELEDYKYNYFNPQLRNLTYIRFQGFSAKDRFFDKVFKDYQVTSFYSFSEEGRESEKNNSFIKRIENDKIVTIGFTSQFTSDLNSYWTMTSGAEGYFDKVKSTRNDFNTSENISIFKRGLYPDGSTNSNIAIFNLHKIKYKKFIFDVGLRYNSYLIKVPEETLGNIEISPSAFVWKAGVARKISDEQLVGFSVNKAFRAPNIDDMGTLGIIDFRYEVPSNDLRPETSINMEINYKLNLENLWFEFSAFRNNLTDFIGRVRTSVNGLDSIDGYPIYIKQNSSEAYIQGLESNIRFSPVEKLTIESNISYTFGENITKNEPMRRIPPINGQLALDYRPIKQISLRTEVLFAGTQDRLAAGDIDDNRIAEGGTQSWAIWNLFASYRISNLSINFGFQNILNEDYRYHGSGINMYGRSARFSINYKIGLL